MRKKIWLLIGFCVAIANTACVSDEAPAITRHTLEHGGLEREYFVYLPSGYDGDKEFPLAIFLHGYGGTATGTEAEVTQGLNAYAEKFGYVMIYPQGTWFMADDAPGTQWEATSWNHITDGFDEGPDGPTCAVDAVRFPCPPECGSCGKCGWSSCHDDVGFLKALVAAATQDYALADRSVFIAGFSNGAQMVNRIACDASELFTAVATIAGRLERGYECAPKNHLPLLQITGADDQVTPVNGRRSSSGYFYASATSSAERWLDGQACGVERSEWTLPTLAGIEVQCTLACGETAYPVVNCVWEGGDHRWPGTPGVRGSNGYCVTALQSASMPDQTLCISPDPDATFWGSQLLFEFFDEHRGN